MSEEFKVGDIVSPSWEPTAIAVVTDCVKGCDQYEIKAIWRENNQEARCRNCSICPCFKAQAIN